jgi:leucyl-tRNA synthetase
MLAPFAPHMAEELWRKIGGQGETIFRVPWPEVDPSALQVDEVEIAVQVNGKVRARLRIPRGLGEEQAGAAARELDAVKALIEGKTLVRAIWVPDKLLNLVVK